MKIGIYDPYLDDLGGGEKYMMTVAECLSKHHKVSVFWDNEENLRDIKRRFLLDFTNVKLAKNIFSHDVSLTQKLSESRKYDCIIVLSDGSIPFLLSKKLFLHIQQPIETIKHLSLSNKLKLKRVNGIFYNSQFTKEFNEKIFKNVKSSVLYPPVTLKSSETEKKNIILHVGRFRSKNSGGDDYKKQGFMIDAFKKMVDREMVNNWKFFIAASVHKEDEETFAVLQKSAEGYPIEFFINKTNTELWELYNKAKIYWHASGYGEDLSTHPSFAEHFGISTVEAMSAGAVPVVLSAGGQKEIVTHNDNGLVWNTLEELFEQTKKVIKDHTLWERLSKNARIRARDFSREKFSEELLEIIK